MNLCSAHIVWTYTKHIYLKKRESSSETKTERWDKWTQKNWCRTSCFFPTWFGFFLFLFVFVIRKLYLNFLTLATWQPLWTDVRWKSFWARKKNMKSEITLKSINSMRCTKKKNEYIYLSYFWKFHLQENWK